MTTRSRIERVFLAFLIFILTGSLLFFFPSGDKFDYLEGNPQYQITLTVCYGLTAVLAAIHHREIVATVKQSASLIGLSILALASPLWAESPAIAFRHALAVTGTTLVGVYLASRLEPYEVILLVRRVLRILAVASLLIAVFLPSRGIEAVDPLHIGDWTGIYGNKNKLGAYVAIPLLIDCFMHLRRRQKVFWFGLYLVLLVKSGSASPLVALVATGIVVTLLMRLRIRHRLSMKAVAISTGAVICLLASLTFGTGVIPFVLGRSTDLSGRTGLWSALLPIAWSHRFLGYGYDAFWAGAADDYYTLARQLYWAPMYSHNGYLEVLVSLGLVGVALALRFLTRGGRFAFLEAENGASQTGSVTLALLIFYLIRNLTECTILIANDFEWTLLVAMLLAVIPRRTTAVRTLHQSPSVAHEYA